MCPVYNARSARENGYSGHVGMFASDPAEYLRRIPIGARHHSAKADRSVRLNLPPLGHSLLVLSLWRCLLPDSVRIVHRATVGSDAKLCHRPGRETIIGPHGTEGAEISQELHLQKCYGSYTR